MGTNTPHTCIDGLTWQKKARRFSQFELKVGKLRFPIHFVCVSAALYHRGVRGRHFPLRWIWPIWTPNSLHFAHAVHFAHGVQNLLLTFDCRSDWFWGFGTLPDLNLPRHKTSVLLTRLFHLVLSSNFRLSKKMHMISPSGIAVHVHTTLPGWCHFQNSCRVWNTGVLFVFLISCIALSLQFLASQQNEKIKQKLRLPADKRKKRNNNENEAPQRVNARRHQKPCRSPGSNRIPTPIRVNRFINWAKSSSSCFF